MRKFIIDMTMSYDFQVTIEAESEEEAKAKFTSTPLEKFGDYQFKSPSLAIKDVVLNEFDPRFYKDDGKVK